MFERPVRVHPKTSVLDSGSGVAIDDSAGRGIHRVLGRSSGADIRLMGNNELGRPGTAEVAPNHLWGEVIGVDGPIG